MPSWMLVILIALATHRATRLITRDSIPLIAVPRDAFVQRWGGFSDAKTREERRLSLNGSRTNVLMKSLAYLWECDWCTSVWVSATLTFIAWQLTVLGDLSWFTGILVALTASGVTGLIAQREPD